MSIPIKFETVGEDSFEITRSTSGIVTIGREPENDIVVDSTSVSRRHACIFSAGSQWVLRDFESTNGTWINGVKVVPGSDCLLRLGDVVQFADVLIKISASDGQTHTQSAESLLIFKGEHFDREIPFDAATSRFVVGGPEADETYENVSTDRPLIIVTRNPHGLEAIVDSRNTATGVGVVVDGTAVSGNVVLKDRSQITSGPLNIFVNLAPTHNAAGQSFSDRNAARPRSMSGVHSRKDLGLENLTEIEEDKKRLLDSRRFVFGDADKDSTTQTQFTPAGQRGKTGGRSSHEVSSAVRFSAVGNEDEPNLNEKTIKVLIGFGVFVVFALIILLIILLLYR
ncbi:FHA domain-containing protein [bacterium]|nr:FHA domain-containing protein [bacterium]